MSCEMSSSSPVRSQHARTGVVTFSASPPSRGRLLRQFSTNKDDLEERRDEDHKTKQQPPQPSFPPHHPHHHPHFRRSGGGGSARVRSNVRATYVKHSRSTESSSSSGQNYDPHHSRNNSCPSRSSQRQRLQQQQQQVQPLLQQQQQLKHQPRRPRQRPPPLNINPAVGLLWESNQTSSTDCSVASSVSPPPTVTTAERSSSSGPPSSTSPSPPPPRSPRSPQPFPRQQQQQQQPPRRPPLSPIPHSPQPHSGSSSRGHMISPPMSPHSPFSPRPSYTPSPLQSPVPGGCRSPMVVGGNLARLANRRKSTAVTTTQNMRRRTSNFLELPVADYERQRRYCSLPEHGYNPRSAGSASEFYRLRAFSISPKGALIKHGDQIASRRSKSSAGSTANTSRQASRSPSRNASPFASHSGSRDNSPLPRSPTAASGGRQPLKSSSPYSSSRHSVAEEDEALEDDVLEAVADEGEELSRKFRVCILGQNDAGKTALVSQFLTSEYMNTYDASLDEEFGERSVSVVLDGQESELIFIDHTNGEMSVENTLSTYEPHACVIVYSVVDRRSFHMAEDVLGYLWRIGYNASIILVGNKVDLERSRVIHHEEGKKLATNFSAKFIETSAGIQHNVDELLVGVLKQIRLHLEKDLADERKRMKKERKQQQRRKNSGKKGKRKSVSSAFDFGSSEVTATNTTAPMEAAAAFEAARKSPLPSPLHTLQIARDILTRVCLNTKQSSVASKSCENLHVL